MKIDGISKDSLLVEPRWCPCAGSCGGITCAGECMGCQGTCTTTCIGTCSGSVMKY